MEEAEVEPDEAEALQERKRDVERESDVGSMTVVRGSLPPSDRLTAVVSGWGGFGAAALVTMGGEEANTPAKTLVPPPLVGLVLLTLQATAEVKLVAAGVNGGGPMGMSGASTAKIQL